MALTNRQKYLLQLTNQLSQNLIASNNTNTNANDAEVRNNVSVDLPGFDFNAGFNFDFDTETEAPAEPTPTPDSTTLRDVLMDLVNEQVEVTTPFGPVTGTLIAVKSDYIVLIDADGSQVLVRMENIELVSNL
ncbi:DUF2642 domain-containing protein [Lentibacillus lipolyticus]|nr:DUF2642 domain-containing protein [Lentibacillus lipolyticus]